MSTAAIDFSKYEQAAPAAAPAGIDFSKYETTAPAKPASLGRDALGEIPNNFVTRIGHRIKENLDIPAQIGHAADAITEGIKNIKNGGPSKMPEFIAALKQYADPEKLAADLITGYITAGAPDLGFPKVPKGVPEPPPWWRAPEAAAGAEAGAESSAVAKVLDIAKKIPGISHKAHLADFVRQMVEDKLAPATPAAPTAPSYQGPTGPPELWGKRIPVESPATTATPAPQTAAPPTPSAAAVAPAAAAAAPPAAAPQLETMLNDALSSKPIGPGVPKATQAQLETLLNDALGGKALEKSVPLKAQRSAAAAPKLPEGFTRVESSALRGYKYDPATEEFESITNTGQHYVHGNVLPEEAEAFKAADSKGKAWNELRQSSPLVAKVINGKRISTSGSMGLRSARPEPEPEPAAPKSTATPSEDDLMRLLEQSLAQARAGKTLSSLK
jgi:hypothetical protein